MGKCNCQGKLTKNHLSSNAEHVEKHFNNGTKKIRVHDAISRAFPPGSRLLSTRTHLKLSFIEDFYDTGDGEFCKITCNLCENCWCEIYKMPKRTFESIKRLEKLKILQSQVRDTVRSYVPNRPKNNSNVGAFETILDARKFFNSLDKNAPRPKEEDIRYYSFI